MRVEFENFLSELFPGFYESVLFNSDTEYFLSEYEGKKMEIKDYKGYENAVAEDVCNLWWNSVDDSIIKLIKFNRISSPREYNFYTDVIIADVELDYDNLREYLIDNSDAFQNYLSKYYTSRDGFISFIENDIDKFIDNYDMIEMNPNIDYMKYLDVAIEFYIMECVNEDGYYFDNLSEIATNRQFEYAVEVEENNKGEDN